MGNADGEAALFVTGRKVGDAVGRWWCGGLGGSGLIVRMDFPFQ